VKTLAVVCWEFEVYSEQKQQETVNTGGISLPAAAVMFLSLSLSLSPSPLPNILLSYGGLLSGNEATGA